MTKKKVKTEVATTEVVTKVAKKRKIGLNVKADPQLPLPQELAKFGCLCDADTFLDALCDVAAEIAPGMTDERITYNPSKSAEFCWHVRFRVDCIALTDEFILRRMVSIRKQERKKEKAEEEAARLTAAAQTTDDGEVVDDEAEELWDCPMPSGDVWMECEANFSLVMNNYASRTLRITAQKDGWHLIREWGRHRSPYVIEYGGEFDPLFLCAVVTREPNPFIDWLMERSDCPDWLREQLERFNMDRPLSTPSELVPLYRDD